jgi:hypothetical protein
MVFTGDDLFRTKLIEYGETVTKEIIKQEWPQYHGNGSYDDVLQFLQYQFVGTCNKSSLHGLTIKASYVVSAMDGPLVLQTFQSIMEHIENRSPLSLK